ncbi:MAG: rRNA maturation RNase YbeY [Candidatus Omnitrophota bacterium]|jgi:probable rRNA maturation factor
MIKIKDKGTKSARLKTRTRGLVNIEIVSRQNLIRLNSKNILIVLHEILNLLKLSCGSVSVVFCDDKFITKLNRKFFKRNQSTDVISFPLADISTPGYLGEIVISVEQAKKTCDFYEKKWQEELVLYVIHGILHLVGYDDIKKKERMAMEQKQEEILSGLLQKYKKTIYSIG